MGIGWRSSSQFEEIAQIFRAECIDLLLVVDDAL
jgi:hypothetical protein